MILLFESFIKISKNGNSCSLVSIVNLIEGCREFRIMWKSSKSFLDFVQKIKQSSRYRFHFWTIYSLKIWPKLFPTSSYIFSSRYAITKFAYDGATFVPIAVPLVCLYVSPSKLNVFSSNIILMASMMKSVRNLPAIIIRNFSTQYRIAERPKSCGMFVYKLVTSKVVRIVLFGTVVGMKLRKYIYIYMGINDQPLQQNRFDVYETLEEMKYSLPNTCV